MSLVSKNIFFIILLILVRNLYAQEVHSLKVDTFLNINNIENTNCHSCLLKYPIEFSSSQLFQSQVLLQIKDKQSVAYDSSDYPLEILSVNYYPEKRKGYLKIVYIRDTDTMYQKGKFYLSDTIYKGYYLQKKISYNYYKLIKDSIWDIGHKGEYYTYKMNVLHGKYQSYNTPEGETGNYVNGYQIGLCQWFDSDKQRYIEDFYDASGNCLYSKQYKEFPAKLLQKETYLIINDKDNFGLDNTYSLKSLKWYFREYDAEGYLTYEGYKKWDEKRDNHIFYGIHKYYSKNKLVKTIQYDNNGKILSTKQIK